MTLVTSWTAPGTPGDPHRIDPAPPEAGRGEPSAAVAQTEAPHSPPAQAPLTPSTDVADASAVADDTAAATTTLAEPESTVLAAPAPSADLIDEVDAATAMPIPIPTDAPSELLKELSDALAAFGLALPATAAGTETRPESDDVAEAAPTEDLVTADPVDTSALAAAAAAAVAAVEPATAQPVVDAPAAAHPTVAPAVPATVASDSSQHETAPLVIPRAFTAPVDEAPSAAAPVALTTAPEATASATGVPVASPPVHDDSVIADEPHSDEPGSDDGAGPANPRSGFFGSLPSFDSGRGRTVAIIGAIVVALIAAGTLAFGVLGGSESDGASSAAVAPGTRTQQTLLFQVTDINGLALGTVLFGRAVNGGDSSPVGLLIPARVLTEAPGAGSITVAETTRIGPPALAAASLSESLGVTVDEVWRVDRAGLKAMIDKVGGVTVDVTTAIQDSQGRQWLTVGPGQKLSGLDASRYATNLTAAELEEARTARLSAVLAAWFAAAPTDPNALRDMVGAPEGAASTTDVAGVATFLGPLVDAARGAGVTFSNVPAKRIDTGSENPALRLDNKAVAETVSTMFAGSLPAEPAGGRLRVLVQNGVGTPGLGDSARTKLVAAGMDFVAGGNAPRFGRATTVVIVPDATPESRVMGRSVASALGLPPTAVRAAQQGQSMADVIVVLGADFTGS